MKKGILIVFSLLWVLVAFNHSHAQESVLSTGGNASGSGGTVSYSIGQVLYTIATDSSGSVALGVQQPYEISIVAGIEMGNPIQLMAAVYPNPTAGSVILKVDGLTGSSLEYHLFGVDGIGLQNRKISGQETLISLESLASGVYFLSVYDREKVLKTFKIVKR